MSHRPHGDLNLAVLGCGQAAALHLNALAASRAEGKRVFRPSLHLLDTRRTAAEALTQHVLAPEVHHRTDWPPPRIHDSLKDLLRDLDPDRTVVDVCAPNPLHASLVDRCLQRGFRRFLVEKPMFLASADCRRLVQSGVSIVGVHNYLFSRVTRRLRWVLRTFSLVPEEAQLEFNKDRRADSRARRGFNGAGAPHAVEVEVPHLFYMADALFGPLQVQECVSWGMQLDGGLIPGHGGARVTLRSANGVRVLCVSSLSAPPAACRRRILIRCREGMCVEGCYPLSRSTTFDGQVTLSCRGRTLETWREDDRSIDVCVPILLSRLLGDCLENRLDRAGMAVARLIEESHRLDREVDPPRDSPGDARAAPMLEIGGGSPP